MPMILLDVPFESEIEAHFLWALVQQSPQVMITVPAGDAHSASQLERRGVKVQVIEEAEQNDLTQLARYLFSKEPPPKEHAQVSWCGFRRPAKGANVSRSRAAS